MRHLTHYPDRDDPAVIGGLHRAPTLSVWEGVREHAPEMVLGEHDPRVQALAPDAADAARSIGIRPGSPRGGVRGQPTQARGAGSKPLAVDSIAVAEEIPGRRGPREGRDQLLCGPRCSAEISVQWRRQLLGDPCS